MDFSSFKTDKKLENEGVWRNCGKGRVLIASTSSERYRAALKKILAPHEMSIALGAMDDKEAEGWLIEAEAEGLIINWEGFTEDGEPCPYSAENAKRLLSEAPRFREFIKRQAASIENFRQQKEDAEVKNS